MNPEDADPTKCVDNWPLPSLSPASREKMKVELWKAHAAFLRSPGTITFPFRFVEPMQQAFNAIARVFFDARLLTVEVLEKQLPLFIFDWQLRQSGIWMWTTL
jgi:hypothetical protein